MATKCTQALRDQLASVDESSDAWAVFFDNWKSLGPNGEYSNYFFGKDSAYSGVALTGGKLMHVHLVPILDKAALAAWDRDWSRHSRKVSDRALVYADDGRGNYLLIYVLDEPHAHAIARMATLAEKETMQAFAEIAAAFVFDGSVIG